MREAFHFLVSMLETEATMNVRSEVASAVLVWTMDGRKMQSDRVLYETAAYFAAAWIRRDNVRVRGFDPGMVRLD